MLRLAFDFIITWRETRTRPNAYYQVMAILMMGIVQAVDCLEIAGRLSPRSQQVYKEIRAFFPVFREDTPKYKEIERMMVYLKKGRFQEK